MIKFNGNVLTTNKPARVHIVDNWNNDMQEYWPYIVAINFENGQIIKNEFRLGVDMSGREIEKLLEVEINIEQKAALEHAENLERIKREREKRKHDPRRGDLVKVVRGRKVPIGTEAHVFWVGDSGYGPHVGLEIKGERVFVSVRNVEVLNV